MINKNYCRFTLMIGLSVFFITLFMFSSVYAANTFEDPKGRFAINLPDGWKIQPQTDQNVYVFKGGDKSIILEYNPTLNEAGALFAQGLNTLKVSGLPNAAPAEEIKDLTVNNNKARMGVYADEIAYGSIKVKLYGFLGSVALGKGGVYFLSILNEGSLKEMRGALEKSFQSVRNAGQAVTGARDIAPASTKSPSRSTPAGGPSVFTHQYLTLTMPPGWRSQDLQPNFEKEVIAWLKSDTIPGASIMVSCYRGFGFNYSKVRRGGLKTIAAVYPKGQKMLKDKEKIRTEQGEKAIVELWQGVPDSGGQTILMQSPMGIVKTKNCWVLMIGYVQDSYGPQLEEDFLKILKSAK